MPNVVGERFQITIDKAAREELGIQPGDRAVEWIEDGHLVVYFMPKPHNRSLRGILKQPGQETRHVDIQAEKEAAWSARTAEIMEVLAADSARHQDDAK
jgi:AbrB family looped-hinge helix DNA binding protein